MTQSFTQIITGEAASSRLMLPMEAKAPASLEARKTSLLENSSPDGEVENFTSMEAKISSSLNENIQKEIKNSEAGSSASQKIYETKN